MVTEEGPVVTGKILKWGNSYGIRLKKADLERAGLSPGSEAQLRLARKPGKIDLSAFPVFTGGASDVSERHDEYLGAGRSRELRRRKR